MCCFCEMEEEQAREFDAALRNLPTEEHEDDDLVEPRFIDEKRNRPLVSDLTPDEMFRLSVNCVELERRRGYR